MVARTDEKLTEGDSLLATASEQDKRGIYPAHPPGHRLRHGESVGGLRGSDRASQEVR